MSTAYSSAKQQYIGNGVTTEWGFDFPIQKHSELKVYLKRSTSPQVLLEEGVDYSFVTENTITFPIKTGEAKLQAADVLALQRESVFESEYNFSNQQRLEPEEVMHADDNLERQIQELKRDVSQAIRIQPTSNIDTDEYFLAVESIYENLDNITNVSGISAEIVNCSDNISDISTVSSNIANVNTVGQSISNVNTVANNISDVNTASLNIEAIKDAPNQANSASQSASDASQSAANAANSATASANSATDSANSATASATSAQAAQDALNDVQGLIATPIGTIFQSVYVDESLDIARKLNGQLISSTKFTGFRSWLNTVQTANPNLFTTETNWQSEKTNSKLGQCGKFVVDDTAGTIRLPCVVNAQGLLGLSGIGTIKNESLPNITGETVVRIQTNSPEGGNTIHTNTVSGAFVETGTIGFMNGGSEMTSNYLKGNFDASRSSSAYQNNAPVQQEAVQYPYYIQVATGVEETLPAIREYEINTPFFFGQSMYSDVAPDNVSWLASNGQWNAKSVYPDYYDWLVEQMNKGVDRFKGTTAYQFKGNTTETEAYTPSFATRNPVVGSAIYGGSPIQILGHATQVNADGSVVVQDVVNNITVTLVFKQELPNINWFTDYDFIVNTTDQTFRLPLLNGEEDLPGNTSINLAMQASGSTYTASANGTVFFVSTSTSTNQFVALQNNTSGEPSKSVYSSGSGQSFKMLLDVKRGDVFMVAYQTSPEYLRFIPAIGNGSLYYYVGDTVQDSSLINAGAVLGQLSNKADIGLSNLSAAGQAKFDEKANVSQFQVVSALPAAPNANVFYFIPE